MKITIADNQEPIRIDIFLARTYPKHSRAYWQKKITDKLITVNEKHVTKHTELTPGDMIQIKRNPPKRKNTAEIPDIHIIEETDDFIVIEKPINLITHPNKQSMHMPSVATWATAHDPRIAHIGDDTKHRPGIVHRLDKDVSGIMIIAKTHQFYEHLKSQFQERTVEKHYIALVHGRDLEQEFDITFSLARNKKTGKMSAMPENNENGKPALTHCAVKQQFTSSTLLEVSPQTGRTHQIRAHLFAYGHPIVGDALYNSKQFITKLDDALGRIFLHAHIITFADRSGQKRSYTSPLPETLAAFLKTLKQVGE